MKFRVLLGLLGLALSLSLTASPPWPPNSYRPHGSANMKLF